METVEQVLDVARLAPFAGNSQPWKYGVVTDVDMRVARAAASPGLSTAWGTLQGGGPEAETRELLGGPEVVTIDHIVPLGYADERECDRAVAPLRQGNGRCAGSPWTL